MLNLYYTYIVENKNLANQYSQKISKYNRNRIRRMKKARNITINQIIIGELLLRYILRKFYQISENNINIKRTPEGKPYLVNSELYFNISHSGNMVLCGCDYKPIGVDVQLIKSDMLLDPWLFSATEAYFKMRGGKINYNDFNIEIDDIKGKKTVKIMGKKKYDIYQKLLFDKYVISVSRTNFNEIENEVLIQEVQYIDLLNSSTSERSF